MDLIIGLLRLLLIFIVIIILDYIWLGIITKRFIIQEFGTLIKVNNGSIEIKLLAGLLAWFMLALGVFMFAVIPSESLLQATILGALFGFISYSIFDLTNLTFIADYPIKFAIIDIVWGTTLCSLAAIAGFYTMILF